VILLDSTEHIHKTKNFVAKNIAILLTLLLVACGNGGYFDALGGYFVHPGQRVAWNIADMG
jgi:hypothetical protein